MGRYRFMGDVRSRGPMYTIFLQGVKYSKGAPCLDFRIISLKKWLKHQYIEYREVPVCGGHKISS